MLPDGGRTGSRTMLHNLVHVRARAHLPPSRKAATRGGVVVEVVTGALVRPARLFDPPGMTS